MAKSFWNAPIGPNKDNGEDWYAVEDRKIADMYGEGILRTFCTDAGIIVYFCGICNCEMNGKPSLKSHCDGMKHLKKKKQFDEGKLEASFSQKIQKYSNIKTSSTSQKRSLTDLASSSKVWKRPATGDLREKSGRYPPPHIEPVPKQKESVRLSGTSTGDILQKLGSCCIKNPEDADLALDVMETLTRTLIEYGRKKNENKAVEIFIDAQYKISNLRSLQAANMTKDQ